MGWQGWLALIGGIVAAASQWVTSVPYLAVIGGVLAIIAGIGDMMK